MFYQKTGAFGAPFLYVVEILNIWHNYSLFNVLNDNKSTDYSS